MSESNKFTPGPWARSSESPKIIMSGSFIDGHDGYMIGSVTGNDNSGFYASEKEAVANATLIIAAPELLNMLEECSNELRVMIDRHNSRDNSDGSYSYDYQTVQESQELIAKARGQQ